MAKAKAKETTMTRVAINHTGVALLALIASAPDGILALTEAEGADIVNAGQAELVDVNEDGTANVQLTQLGHNLLAATPASKRGKVTVGAVTMGIAMPERQRKTPVFTGERGSKYPFGDMEIGASFHVPKTEENPKPLTAINSAIVVARVKFSEAVLNEDGSPVLETVTVKEYQKDANGKFAKDVDGKRIVASTTTETKPATKLTRNFQAFEVGANDPEGEGVRVWRVA